MPMEQVTAPVPALSAAVLVGGRSRRMGQDKALLRLDGEPLVARAVRLLGGLSDDVMVVADDPVRYAAVVAARLIADGGDGGEGPLVGIIAALEAAYHDRVLVIPTDMPNLTDALLRAVGTHHPSHTVLAESSLGHPEPLVGCYHRSALPTLRAALAANQRRLTSLVAALGAVILPADALGALEGVFRNVNTPDDWTRLVTGAEGMGRMIKGEA